jgi:hypothetical protein
VLVATIMGLQHSSHEIRYKPILGSMNPKSQKMRKQRGISVENGTMILQGDPLVTTIFPRETNLLEYHVNYQGEIR